MSESGAAGKGREPLDRPVSEIVREATSEWLHRHAPNIDLETREEPPVFRAGAIRVPPDTLREAGNRDA